MWKATSVGCPRGVGTGTPKGDLVQMGLGRQARRGEHRRWSSEQGLSTDLNAVSNILEVRAQAGSEVGWKGHEPVRTWVQSLSGAQLSVTPGTAARQAPLSFTVSQSLLTFLSIESVMPSNHPNLCHTLLFLPSILPSIRVFSSESAIHTRWPKYWSFSFSISPSNEYSGLISFRMD